jgi:FKBP-type peptidyl-prolyl cis-trans isomerase SlyD
MAIEKIEDGVVVSLAYTLTVDGEEVDRADADDPLEYLHGAENIVPGLEDALTGRKVGDKLSVTLNPDQAYGEYDEDDIEVVERDEIPDADLLRTGMLIEAEDESGNVSLGMVREINDGNIVLDFNPPLAGKTLTYNVEVLGLREADSEELAHGHPHGLHSHFDEFDDDDDDYDWDDDDEFDEDGYEYYDDDEEFDDDYKGDGRA